MILVWSPATIQIIDHFILHHQRISIVIITLMTFMIIMIMMLTCDTLKGGILASFHLQFAPSWLDALRGAGLTMVNII